MIVKSQIPVTSKETYYQLIEDVAEDVDYMELIEKSMNITEKIGVEKVKEYSNYNIVKLDECVEESIQDTIYNDSVDTQELIDRKMAEERVYKDLYDQKH